MAPICFADPDTKGNSMIPRQTLRDEYLDPNINPSDLGFCCIYLGGSAAHKASVYQLEQSGSDWDGLGFVHTRQDLVNLMTRYRSQLLRLLKVDYIDGSDESWHDAVNSLEWDVVSISGWTKKGSNRAMKIWAREHLETIMRNISTQRFGVLAQKFPRSIQSNHPMHGSALLISQAIRLTKDISLRFEDDFISVPFSVGDRVFFSFSPALMCDLLIASRCVYESAPGLSSELKSLTLSKWLARSDESSIVKLLPQLYRWPTFPTSFKEYLVERYSKLNLDTEYPGRNENLGKICIRSTQDNNVRRTYQALLFDPLRKEQCLPLQHFCEPGRLFGITLASESQYTIKRRPWGKNLALLRGNSSTIGTLSISDEGRTYQILETQIDCLANALVALPSLYVFYPRERLQPLVAIDPDQCKAFYKHQGGSCLLDERIWFNQQRGLTFEPKEQFRFERWLLSCHMCMAQDVMMAYQASWSLSGSKNGGPCHRKSRPHIFYERLRVWNGMGDPTIAYLANQHQMGMDKLTNIPVTINGRCYGTIGNQLLQARELLDPTASHFTTMPTVFGIGTLHGGNVFVDDRIGKGTMPALGYMNYDQIGFYPPVVDISTSLYVDAFFPVLFADLFAGDPSVSPSASNTRFSWRIDEEGIFIEHEVNMSLLDRGIATTKLEYVVRPVLNMLDAQNQSGDDQIPSTLCEQVLGNGMFCCAMFMREFPIERPEFFLMNLAVGMRLAQDLRGVLEEIFSWR